MASLLVKTVEEKADKNNVEMKLKSNVNVYKAMPKSIKQKLLDMKTGVVRSTGGADKETRVKNNGVKHTDVLNTVNKDTGVVVKDMVEELLARVDKNNCRFVLLCSVSF